MSNILTQREKDSIELHKEIIIRKLSWIIDNWNIISTRDKEELEIDFFYSFNDLFYIHSGLCINADLAFLPSKVKWVMFNTFSKTCGDVSYPLSNFEDYDQIRNFTETPQRLELAKHCLDFIENERWKEHFVVEGI